MCSSGPCKAVVLLANACSTAAAAAVDELLVLGRWRTAARTLSLSIVRGSEVDGRSLAMILRRLDDMPDR